MAGSTAQPLCSDAAQRIAGSKIVRIDRVLYEVGGVVEPGSGPLEVHLEDGAVFLFSGASDGESLRVEAQPWTDPFEGAMSPENEEFVAQSGKWSRVSVSNEAPYNELIGAKVNAVELLENEFGREAGLAIETDARTLWFVVQGDEDHAFWAFPLGYRTRTRYPSDAAQGRSTRTARR